MAAKPRNSRSPKSARSSGIALLDALVPGGLKKGEICYLVGTPASGRTALCAQFLAGADCGVWIRVGSKLQVPAVLRDAIEEERIKVVDAPATGDFDWRGALTAGQAKRSGCRVVIWSADTLELLSNGSAILQIVSVLRQTKAIAVICGTIGSYGSDVQISTPLMLSASDCVLLTQRQLDESELCAARLLKGQRHGAMTIQYRIRDDQLIIERRSDEDSAKLASAPSQKQKQAYIVIPELFYLSPQHETLVKERVSQVNSQFQHSSFEMLEHPFANGMQYSAQLEEIRKGSEPWDLFIADIYRLREFIRAGLIQPLDSFLPEGWDEQYLPLAVEQCKIDGHVWALPHWTNVGVLVYRRDLLKKHKLDPPRTWEELVRQCRQIGRAEKNPRLQGYGFQGAQVEALTCSFLEMLWGNGGEVYDPSLHISINSAEAVEGLQMLCDLVYKEQVSPAQSASFTEGHTQQMFLDHELLFMRSWPLFLAQVPSTFTAPYEEVSIAPLPTFSPDIAPRGVIGGFCYVIGRHVRNPEVLLEFLRSFYDEPTITRMAIDGWMCSPFRSAYRSPEVLHARRFLKTIPQLLQTGSARSAVPHYTKLTELVRREVNLALRQLKTPKDALDTVATELHNSIFRSFREQRLARAIQYVEEHLHENVHRDRAASVCQLSGSYFSAVFSELYGCSFTRYVSEKRVERAKELLERSGLTISEIGQRVGFKDQSYFCQVFRQFTNMTPSEYRINIMTSAAHH